MGAGSISKWIREMNFKMSSQILNDINLKQYSWFNIGGNAKNFLNQKS